MNLQRKLPDQGMKQSPKRKQNYPHRHGVLTMAEGTVLILGAGASKPYGFPLGSELRDTILKSLSFPESEEVKLLQNCGFNIDDIRKFRSELHDAIHNTIDDFLSDRPSHRGIGSLSIVMALRYCESPNSLFPKRDWYPELVKVLGLDGKPSSIDAILTLNYDRSLEHYLYHTVRVSFEGEKRTKAFQRLAEIPIIHLHGILGKYVPGSFDMDKDLSPEKCMEIAEELRITSDESLDQSEVFARARDICLKASQIYFLGFGYHERILDRLGFKDNWNDAFDKKKMPLIYGTGKNMAGKHIMSLHEKYNSKFTIDDRYDAHSFFKEVIIPNLGA